MKLPCYLIRDLLPLYHDRVLAEQTAADVKEHLDSCADCRTALAALDTETEAETALAAAQTRTETDALRRVRGTLRRRRWLPICGGRIFLLTTAKICPSLPIKKWLS